MTSPSTSSVAQPAATVAAAFIRGRATWLAYLMLGYFSFLQSSLGPITPSLRDDLGLSYTVASLHVSGFAIGSVLIGLFGDRVARQLGRRAAFWGGAAGMAAGALLLIGSPVVAGTIAATLLMGVCGGLLMLTIQANLSDLHGSARVIAIAEANVAASACAVLVAASIGAFERTGIGWRGAIVAALLAGVVLAARYRDVEFPRGIRPAAGRREASRRLPRAFWLASVIMFVGVAAEWSIGYWGAEFLGQEGGLSRSFASAAMSAYFIAMAAGRFGGSRLASRHDGRLLLIGTLVVALAGFPLLWLAPLAPLRLLGLFVTGLGIASIYPFTVGVAMAAAPADADVVTARLMLSGASAILLAPFLLGVLADATDIGTAFGVALPLLIAAVYLAARLPAAPTTPATR